MIDQVRAFLRALGVEYKKIILMDMHRMASGWDPQGLLPQATAAGGKKKAFKHLPLHFPVRVRHKLEWSHFICRSSH
jgi:hypothetical protein